MSMDPDGVILRPAEAADQMLIRRMILTAHLNPFHLHWVNFIIAESVSGEVLGCGQIKPHRDGSRELASIYVVPEARGRGVARKIIEELLSKEMPPLWLICQRSLTDLYRGLGFQEVEELAQLPVNLRRMKRLIRIFSGRRSGDILAVMRWDVE